MTIPAPRLSLVKVPSTLLYPSDADRSSVFHVVPQAILEGFGETVIFKRSGGGGGGGVGAGPTKESD